MSCSASRADPAEQPTPIEKLLCEDPLKLNSTAVEYPHISLRTRALSPPIAAFTLPRPPILAKHCASMQRSYTGWQLGRLVESSVSNTRSISFNGCREGHRGPWVSNSLPLSCAEKADRSLLMTCTTSCCEVSCLDVKTGSFEPCRMPI